MTVPIRSIIVSAVLLSEQAGQQKILLMKRVNGRFWSHVAGKIERGESASQAAAREVREETGVQTHTLYSADYLEQFYEASENIIELIPVFVVYCGPDQPILLNDEHTEYGWYSVQEAIGMAEFGGQRLLYQYIGDNFISRKPSDLLQIKMY